MICRAHRWFAEALWRTRVTMWAEDRAAPLDGSPEVVTHSRRPLLFDLWKSADVDYRTAAAFPPGEDWEIRVDGILVSGSRHLRRVTVDEDALEAELSYNGMEDTEIWAISWNGTKLTVDCAKAEGRGRAMRAIALLRQNPGRRISSPLLASLRRRRVCKEGSSSSERETVRLRELVDIISARLTSGLVNLETADKEVQSHLNTRINPSPLDDGEIQLNGTRCGLPRSELTTGPPQGNREHGGSRNRKPSSGGGAFQSRRISI